MYIFLLAWRYLRTRFIAVASIVSVTLGVATLIVVNAVMEGFVDQMHTRLHGILSDIDVSPPGLGEITDVETRLQEIRDVCGDDLLSMTTLVRVPALLQYRFNGQPMTHQLLLVGIDDETYGKVTDFQPFLLNELNREKISFSLRESGYPKELGECGWPWRRRLAEYDEMRRQQWDEFQKRREQEDKRHSPPLAISGTTGGPAGSADVANSLRTVPPELPASPPVLPAEGIQENNNTQSTGSGVPRSSDSSQEFRAPIRDRDIFNRSSDQYAGIVLGRAISHRNIPARDDMPARDIFLLRPGDDVSITLPTAGESPKPILENCTIVDLYSSKMHEYDSSFAFMSLSRLQKIRGMIDPLTGEATVSSIQIRTRPGADLDKLRDALILRMPPHLSLNVQTWQDTQRPLLNAVNLELTILNILLFMIIGVAGFGILATFFMIVVEKTRDIGILKSLGAPGRGVMSIFLGYGLSLGTVGTGAGIILGLLFVSNINSIADFIQYLTGRQIYDPMIYFFEEIPVIVSPWMVAWVAGGAILIAVLASVLPALRAARFHPVEALRYE
jgi:lipoprotein-releasing system permease protein